MKRVALTFCILVGCAFLGAVVFYTHSQYVRAQAVPANIESGFKAINAQITSDTTRTRLNTVSLEMNIIDDSRQGYGHLSVDDLQQDVEDMEWAKTMLPDSATDALHDLDRDIAWCNRRLHKAHK